MMIGCGICTDIFGNMTDEYSRKGEIPDNDLLVRLTSGGIIGDRTVGDSCSSSPNPRRMGRESGGLLKIEERSSLYYQARVEDSS